MSIQRIHIIGYDEVVLMLGLLGIDGTIIYDSSDFLREFKRLVGNPLIRMIIIALDLPEDIMEDIINFKLNNRRPFIFCLPDIFQPNIEEKDIVLSKIIESIGKIVS